MFPRKRLGLRREAITLALPVVWLLTLSLPGLADLPLTVRVKNDLSEKRTRAPVTWSVPFAPEDAVLDPLSLTLLYRGAPLAFQATPMARGPALRPTAPGRFPGFSSISSSTSLLSRRSHSRSCAKAGRRL